MIQTANVVPGSESPAAEGTTGAIRCTLALPDGSRRAAVLKRGPLAQVAAEAFSAILLRAWGLEVPEPFLVVEADTLAFASADAGYPSLRKRLGLDTLPDGPARATAAAVGSLLATSLPSAGLAAAADEAIENHDRNLGNILWDGATEAWIDHAYALGQAPPHVGTSNKLCNMAERAGTQNALRTAAVAQALTVSQSAPAAAGAALPQVLNGDALAQRVSGRLAGLASRLLARFPQPRDLLSPP